MRMRPPLLLATKASWRQFVRCSGVTLAWLSARPSPPQGIFLERPEALKRFFTVLALRDQVVPPTLNLVHPDEAADGLDLVGLKSRTMLITHALSNGFGFGGVNASVLFRRWEPKS